MKLRRARSLVAYWVDGELVLEDYLAEPSEDGEKSGVAVDGVAVDLLSKFDDWTDMDSVARQFDGYAPESLREAAQTLVSAGLLRTPEQGDREDLVLRQWRTWGEQAAYFYFGTKDTAYISADGAAADADLAAQRARIRAEIAESGPPPRPFKRQPDSRRIYLSRAFLPLRHEFGDVLMSRRTHRKFTGTPVPMRSLSTVLHYTFAPMHFYDAGVLGKLMLRTSPCGGARHESECYVAIRSVESVPPGLYRYSPEDHSLEVVSDHLDEERLDRVLFAQEMVTKAGFTCFLTLNLDRAMYKYRSARMLRTVLLNTGHVAQTFALCATAVGLGPAQTDAFRDTELEEMLEIDGVSETAVYVLAAGTPERRTDGLPIEDPYEEVERRIGGRLEAGSS